ncbi:MAG: hypothetical protein ACRDQD_02430 [Nocardioidaceae bacterium]
MTGAVKERFTFQSEAETVVGDLFLPTQTAPTGVVIAVGPLTSVKEQASGTYAQAMAERGYAALAFDYRTSARAAASPGSLRTPPRTSTTSRTPRQRSGPTTG